MKLSGSRCEFTLFLIIAGFLYLTQLADGANEFRRCYNTSVEMHCFSIQYDNNNGPLITSNDNARQRCSDLKSNLIIIKDEETNNIVKSYMSDSSNPIRNQYVWTDAFRISDYNSTHTWHWVNSTLPNIPDSAISPPQDNAWYVASLESRSQNGRSQFYFTTQEPHFPNSYICEYPVSICPSTGSNVLQFADICYIAVKASLSWYEARNRCLKDGGDLASFANVNNINLTSWLGSDPNVRFWIGLRFTWYIWKASGEDVKFAKWILDNDWSALCLIVCYNCNPSFSWLPKDCNTNDMIYAVCHSVTPLQATTLTAASATTLSVTTQTGNTRSNNTRSNAWNSEKSTESSLMALGIGLGVALGVPLAIFIILTVFFAVKSKRLETLLQQKIRKDITELGAVQEPSVGQVNESATDHYQQLNRNLDSSSGMTYDKLRVEPEQNYEEFSSNNI